MSDLLTSVRFPPETPVFERHPNVRSFLIESQRRVIELACDSSKLRIWRQNIANASPGWSKWPKPNCSVYTPDDLNSAPILLRRLPRQRRASGRASENVSTTPAGFAQLLRRAPGLGNHGLVLGQKFPVSYLKPKGDLLVFCLPRKAVRAPLGPGGDGCRRCPTPARTHLAPWRIWL